MIFELVYADSDIFAGFQRSCTCTDAGRLAKHVVARTETPVLVRTIPGSVKGTRGARNLNGHVMHPYKPASVQEWDEELEVETQVLSPVNSLLFVNKQTYLEALPHLYLNTTFFFDDWQDAQMFATTVGPKCLSLIRAVEMFSDYGRLDSSDSKLSSFIVACMPNIEHLTVSFWDEHAIRLESDDQEGSGEQCDILELALLRFASLKHVRQIDVNMVWELHNNAYGCAPHVVTREAVKKMIRTGDRGVSDRARVHFLRNQSHDFAVDTVDRFPEMVRHSGLSRKWWLEKLAMPYY